MLLSTFFSVTIYNFFSNMITFSRGFLLGRHIVTPEHWISVFLSNFDILENRAQILEISLNFVGGISWSPCQTYWPCYLFNIFNQTGRAHGQLPGCLARTTWLNVKVDFDPNSSSRLLIAIWERLDHQVAQIAQSVDHLSTNPRVVGSIPTPVNKIFQSFHECVRWTILC